MKLINLKCSNCGAALEIDPERTQAFCSYCGAKLFIDDENINITNRIVDEARIKEAEVRLKELEYQHERELREEFIRKEQVTVAVNEGNTNYEIFLSEHFPEWKIRYFKDTPAGLDAVAAKARTAPSAAVALII